MPRRIHVLLAIALPACSASSEATPADPAPVAPVEPAPVAAPPTPPPAAREPVHLTLDQAERRTGPNGIGSVALLARGENAFVGQLELEPLAEIPPHRDPTEEYLVVLEGGGTLLLDGRGVQLSKGSVVYMPANAEVSFANGPGRLVALQVFAGPEPADKYDRWTAVD